MRIRLIVILLLLFVVSWADARGLYPYERFCLETMAQIESSLESHLPSDYEIVETHPSPLGKRFAVATHIRDAWISHNGEVVLKVVLFTWPLPDDPALSNAKISQVRLETDAGHGKAVTLGVAVLGKDEELVGEVVDIVNKSIRPVSGTELQEHVEFNDGNGTGLLLLVTGMIVAAGLIVTVFVWRVKRIRSSLS